MVLGVSVIAAMWLAVSPDLQLLPSEAEPAVTRESLTERRHLIEQDLDRNPPGMGLGFMVGAGALYLAAAPFLLLSIPMFVGAIHDQSGGYGGLSALLGACLVLMGAGPLSLGILVQHLGLDGAREREHTREGLLRERERIDRLLDGLPLARAPGPTVGVSWRF